MREEVGAQMDERAVRAQVIEATNNFRGLLTVTASLMRKSNPRVAGALYVLEREVYEQVSTGLMVDWPETQPEPVPAAKAPKAKRACRHVFGETGRCAKCGQDRQRQRKPKPAAPAGEAP